MIGLPRSRAEAALLIVGLANSNQIKAEVSAALARKSLTKISVKHQKQVEAVWDAANEKALNLLNLVLENNPMKSRIEILERPDVQAVLRQPYEEAAVKSESILRDAWDAAEKDAVQKTKLEFKLLKETWQGHDTDAALLGSLVDDLHANAQAMRNRVGEVVLGDPESVSHRLKVVTSDATRRGSFSVSTAVWGVSTVVRESALAAAGLNKMWVATLDDNTCSHCKWLHGKVVGPGEQFPTAPPGTPKLKVYRGALYGPPRHPRCRCIPVPTKLKKTKFVS